jgi:hypothetical protein
MHTKEIRVEIQVLSRQGKGIRELARETVVAYDPLGTAQRQRRSLGLGCRDQPNSTRTGLPPNAALLDLRANA